MIIMTSKAKVVSDFTRYIFKEDKSEFLGSNIGVSSKKEYDAFLRNHNKLHPTESKMWHFSFSASPEDQVTPEMWGKAAYHLLSELSLLECPYIFLRHTNTAHNHIHLGVSRLRVVDGKLIHRNLNPDMIIKPIARKIEQLLEITPVASYNLNPNFLSPREYQSIAKEANHLRKGEMRGIISKALNTSITIPDFVFHCKQANVEVWIRNKDGDPEQMEGISYSFKDIDVAGKRLGNAFKISSITSAIEAKNAGLPMHFDFRKILKNIGHEIESATAWQGLEIKLRKDNAVISITADRQVNLTIYDAEFNLKLSQQHMEILMQLYQQYLRLMEDERQGQRRFHEDGSYEKKLKQETFRNQSFDFNNENNSNKKSFGM